MNKKITITINLDGTDNNKNRDKENGQTSNIANIYNLTDSDYSFDFSFNNNVGKPGLTSEIEGNIVSFDTFSQSINDISILNEVSCKIYVDGVGSQDDTSSFPALLEGATGNGVQDRVTLIFEKINKLRGYTDSDTEININIIAFSRGSSEGKDLANRLLDTCSDDANLQINKILLFDTVAAINNAPDETHWGLDLSYPEHLGDDTDVYEYYAANEHRQTFSLIPYPEGSVHRTIFPGAHANIGGGYARDILAAGPLAQAINDLSEGDDGLSFDTIPPEIAVRIHLYNAVVMNPYAVRALIMDSRIISEEVGQPGTEPFPLEFHQDHQFELPTDPRDIVLERPNLRQNPISSTIQDVLSGGRVLLNPQEGQNASPEFVALTEQLSKSDESIASIHSFNYQPVALPENMPELPLELQIELELFNLRMEEITYDDNKLDDISQYIDVLKQVNTVFNNFIDDIKSNEPEENNANDQNSEFFQSGFEVLNSASTCITSLINEKTSDSDNLQSEVSVDYEEQSQAHLETIYAINELSQAILNGDVTALGSTTLEYLSSLEDYCDTFRSASDASINQGILSEKNEVLLDIGSTGFDVVGAIDAGENYEAISAGLDLVHQIDTYCNISAESDDNAETTSNNAGISDSMSNKVSVASDAFSLINAIDNDDTLATTSAALELLNNISNQNPFPNANGYLGQAGNLVNVLQHYDSFQQALDSGDTGNLGVAGAQLGSDVIDAYEICGGEVPIDSTTYLADVAAGAQLAQGDSRGAAVSNAANQLLASGNSYGIAAGAALQLANSAGLIDEDAPISPYGLDVFGFYDNAAVQVADDVACTVYASSNPVIGYSSAALKLLDGDVEGAAVSAATTALMCYGPYGWIAAIAITVADKICFADDPASARATYSVDNQGQVIMHIEGDGEMLETAGSYGGYVADVMQCYSDIGGTLIVDGSLPSMEVEAGENPTLRYESDSGGLVTVELNNTERISETVQGVLAAREHGDRVDDVYTICTDAQGNVDIAAADSILAGQGYVKRGITYTHGEIQSRQGVSTGSGVVHGGGNVGQQGQRVRVRDNDITSMPLRPEQRPAQVQGQLLGVMHNGASFSALGSELLAMGLGVGGVLLEVGIIPDSANARQENPIALRETNSRDLLHSVYAIPEPAAANTTDSSSKNVHADDGLPLTTMIPLETEIDLSILPRPSLPAVDAPLPNLQPGNRPDIVDSHGHVSPYAASDSVSTFAQNDQESRQGLQLNKAGATAPVNASQEIDGEAITVEPKAVPQVHQGPELSTELVSPDQEPQQLPEEETPAPIMSGAHFVLNGDTVLRCSAYSLLPEFDGTSRYLDVAGISSLSGLGSSENGHAWIDARGDIRFAPDAGFTGTASFEYTLTTNDGTTEHRLATVEVTAESDGVVLQNDIITLQAGEAMPLERLLANDQAGSNQHLFVYDVRGLEHGHLTTSGEQVFFTPDPGFAGQIDILYWATCETGEYPEMALAELHVLEGDSPPLVTDDRFIIKEDEPFQLTTADLLANDLNPADTSLMVAGVGNANHGTVTMRENGTIVFEPDADYAGSEAGFTYLAVDDGGNQNSGQVTLEVINLPDSPLQTSEFLAADLSAPITFTPDLISQFAIDPDHDPLSMCNLDEVVGADVSMADGVLTLTLQANYNGAPSLTFQLTDPYQQTITGHLTLVPADSSAEATISAEQEPQQAAVSGTADQHPLAANDDPANPELPSLPLPASPTIVPQANNAVISNDIAHPEPVSDSQPAQENLVPEMSASLLQTLEDQPVRISSTLLATTVGIEENELMSWTTDMTAHGEVQLIDGAFTFLPDPDYCGDCAGFSCVVTTATDQFSLWVPIDVVPVNDAPEIIHDLLVINEDEPVRFTPSEIAGFISDIDDDSLHLHGFSGIAGGQMLLDGGIPVFVPESDFYGKAGFAYLAEDAAGETVSGQLEIVILPDNDLPEPVAASAQTLEDRILRLDTADLVHGTADMEDAVLRFGTITAVSDGVAHVDAQGTLTFFPDANFSGQAELSYTVKDSEGGEGTGILAIDVLPVQDSPIAGDDAGIPAWGNSGYVTRLNASLLLANDLDPDNDEIHISAIGPARYGTVEMAGDGNLAYFPPGNDWVGIDSFTYAVEDGQGGAAEATASLDVTLNSQPMVFGEILQTREDEVVTFSQEVLLANDLDPNGDSLLIAEVGEGNHCQIELLEDGTLRLTPELNINREYAEPVSFSYRVSDGISAPITCTALVDIEPVNDAPIAVGEWISGCPEDGSLDFSAAQLLANDMDIELASPIESDSLHLTSIGDPIHGTISLDTGRERLLYTPPPNFFGTDTFAYTISDDQGAEAVAQAEIVVYSVNDNPMVEEDIGSPAEESIWNAYSISALLANDHDPDGDRLFLENPRVTSGHADIRIQGDNLMIRPDAGENRLRIEYSVVDHHGGEETSRLSINRIAAHNYAPEFTGSYKIEDARDPTRVSFSFQVTDRNGGDSWSGNMGDISSINAAQLHSNYPMANLVDHGSGHFTLAYSDIFGSWQPDSSDYATFTLTATDRQGATGTIRVDFTDMNQAYGYYAYSPIILDLDGDGIELLDLESGVCFDWNRDGEAEATGWVDKDDGLLVYDYNRDAQATMADELMLSEYASGVATDLEGLRFFDSNADNRFDTSDETWDDFSIWQDADSDACTDAGELVPLNETGITAIDLEEKPVDEDCAGNHINATVEYEYGEGCTGTAADVTLRGDSIELDLDEDPITASMEETGIDINTEEYAADSPPFSQKEAGEAAISPDAAMEEEASDREQAMTEPDESAEEINTADIDMPGKENPATAVTSSQNTTREDPEDIALSDPQEAEIAEDGVMVDEAEIERATSQLRSDMATYEADCSAEEVVVVPTDLPADDCLPSGNEDPCPELAGA